MQGTPPITEHLIRLADRLNLTEYQRQLIKLWLSPLVAGAGVWLVFIFVGQTPVARASGLALAIVGVALALRWLGSVLAIIGALALAFTPAFWQQTGGGGVLPATLVIALSVAALLGTVIIGMSRRPYVALAAALVVFGAIFASQLGEARSLRFTILAGAWLLFLLFRAILLTNPRPDGPPPARLNAQFRAGIVLILTLGVINDPIFVMFVPAVVLGLAGTHTRLRWWFWIIIAGVVGLGVYGLFTEYYDPRWWSLPVEQAARLARRNNLDSLVAAGWRDPERWLNLFQYISNQFTVIGLLLGIAGLARLTRWYPLPGVMTLVAFASFFVFGLAYYGEDRAILLMPLLIIQVMWMTYAVYTLSEWIAKTVAPAQRPVIQRLAQAVYLLLPVLLLVNILTLPAGG